MKEDSTGEYILMAAVRSHNVNLTKYLVRKGANVNGLDKNRNTALVHLLLSVSGKEDKRPIQVAKILFSKHVNLKRTFSYEGKRATVPQIIAALPSNSVIKKIKELVEKHLRKSVKKHKSKTNETKKIASCIQTCTQRCLTSSSSKRKTARKVISETAE
jgi:ankyrin repeat protein